MQVEAGKTYSINFQVKSGRGAFWTTELIEEMIKVKKAVFRPIYHFYYNEAFFGTLRASSFYPKAVFIAREGIYKFYREKWLEGKFLCEFNFDYKVISKKPEGMRFTYLIKHQSITYLLKPGVSFDENAAFHFQLFKNTKLLGSVYENPTRFSLIIEMKEEIPKIMQVFIFWLGFRAWIGRRGWRYAPFAFIGS